jgi:hypothetical protein
LYHLEQCAHYRNDDGHRRLRVRPPQHRHQEDQATFLREDRAGRRLRPPSCRVQGVWNRALQGSSRFYGENVRRRENTYVASALPRVPPARYRSDIAAYLEEQVRLDHAKNVPTPPDQISRAVPNSIVLRKSLYTKKTFFVDQEFFLQVNYRHSPGHYDHGYVLSYIPAFCVNAIKLWISIPFDRLHLVSFAQLAEHPAATIVVQPPVMLHTKRHLCITLCCWAIARARRIPVNDAFLEAPYSLSKRMPTTRTFTQQGRLPGSGRTARKCGVRYLRLTFNSQGVACTTSSASSPSLCRLLLLTLGLQTRRASPPENAGASKTASAKTQKSRSR